MSDIVKASRGSRGALEIFMLGEPMCTWREPHREEGPKSRAAGADHPEGFVQLVNIHQTPIQDEMPLETTLEKRGAKDACVSAQEVRGIVGIAATLRLLKLCTIV